MGNNKARKKNKLYSFFESKYAINLYHRPSNELIDSYHYIILDNTVGLYIKNYSDSVLVIHDIVPLSNRYLVSFYDEFIEFLVGQTEYTVLISNLGNTRCIVDSCTKAGIPIVDDTRFLSVSEALYNKMKSMYGEDLSKYGSYVLAVQDDPKEENINTSPVIEKTKVEVFKEDIKPKTVIEEFEDFLKKNNQITLLPIDNGLNRFRLQYITVSYKELNNSIIIESIGDDTDKILSSVQYIPVLQYISEFTEYRDVYISNISNGLLYNVCKAMDFEKVKPIEKASYNSLGSYKINKKE